MRKVVTLILLLMAAATAGFAAEEPDKAAGKAKARQLLEEVAEMAGSAKLEVHILALAHLGEEYRDIDAGRAAGWLRQAFAATAAAEGDRKLALQARVVKTAAKASPALGAELLRAMVDPGNESDNGISAADAVIDKMTGDGKFDLAVETLNLIPEPAVFPYAATQKLMEKLPEGDGRRVILFGKAMDTYLKRSEGAFPLLLAKHWKDVPRPMAERALQSVVAATKKLAADEEKSEALKSDKGEVKLASRQTIEYFRLAAVLRALAPKTLDELMAQYPDLKDAVSKFPDGREGTAWGETQTARRGKDGASQNFSGTGTPSEENDDDFSPATMGAIFSLLAPGRDMQNLPAQFQKTQEQTEKVRVLLKDSPAKAIEEAMRVEQPVGRAGALVMIARMVQTKDKDAAAEALSKAIALMPELELPEDRVMISIGVAEVAHVLKDDKLAWTSLERALADAVAIQGHDTNADAPNTAQREYWPSRQACRIAMITAAKAFGAKAATLLPGVNDPDMALLARIDLAGALLGHEITDASVVVTHSDSK